MNDGWVFGYQTPIHNGIFHTSDEFLRTLESWVDESRAAFPEGWKDGVHRILVFPECIASWLVFSGQKRSAYAPLLKQDQALQDVASRWLGDPKDYPEAAKVLEPEALVPLVAELRRVVLQEPRDATWEQRFMRALCALQGPWAAREASRAFAALAESTGSWVVGSSLYAPWFEADGTSQPPTDLQIFSQTPVFDFEGKLKHVSRKGYPTGTERFLDAAPADDPKTFDTPLGRVGVLVCADSWYRSCYETLKREQAEIILVPSYGFNRHRWLKKWEGFQGRPSVLDRAAMEAALADPSFTEADGWRTFTLPGRFGQSLVPTAKVGVNVFAVGHAWGYDVGGESTVAWGLGNQVQTLPSGSIDQGRLLAVQLEAGQVKPHPWKDLAPLRKVYRIHPGLGIARVGDCRDEDGWFVGPEAPGNPPRNPDGTPVKEFKKAGRVKRQAARFRVFELSLDPAGNVTAAREIDSKVADIRWTVQLGNRKAAGPKFLFRVIQPHLNWATFPLIYAGLMRRNPYVPEKDPKNPGVLSREDLVILPAPATVDGANPKASLDGTFMRVPVHLGDLEREATGHLLVLGGRGTAEAVPAPNTPPDIPPDIPGRAPLADFADNDGWYDDVSDGPVKATIRFKGETEDIEAEPAWVLVGPPDFAPEVRGTVTLYDVAEDVGSRPPFGSGDDGEVVFADHVYPVLERVSKSAWVSAHARRAHKPGSKLDLLARADILAEKDPEAQKEAARLFRALRPPGSQASGDPDMPKLGWMEKNPVDPLTLTVTQYARLRRWSEGDFEPGMGNAGKAKPPYQKLPDVEKPHALDRAALESCCGGPFFPGLETNPVIKEASTWEAPFRICRDLEPGTLTEGNAVPWQADFVQCGHGWWPAQRPESVKVSTGQFLAWIPEPFNGLEHPGRFQAMVEGWSRLGFLMPNGAGQEEKERAVAPAPVFPGDPNREET